MLCPAILGYTRTLYIIRAYYIHTPSSQFGIFTMGKKKSKKKKRSGGSGGGGRDGGARRTGSGGDADSTGTGTGSERDRQRQWGAGPASPPGPRQAAGPAGGYDSGADALLLDGAEGIASSTGRARTVHGGTEAKAKTDADADADDDDDDDDDADADAEGPRSGESVKSGKSSKSSESAKSRAALRTGQAAASRADMLDAPDLGSGGGSPMAAPRAAAGGGSELRTPVRSNPTESSSPGPISASALLAQNESLLMDYHYSEFLSPDDVGDRTPASKVRPVADIGSPGRRRAGDSSAPTSASDRGGGRPGPWERRVSAYTSMMQRQAGTAAEPEPAGGTDGSVASRPSQKSHSRAGSQSSMSSIRLLVPHMSDSGSASEEGVGIGMSPGLADPRSSASASASARSSPVQLESFANILPSVNYESSSGMSLATTSLGTATGPVPSATASRSSPRIRPGGINGPWKFLSRRIRGGGEEDEGGGRDPIELKEIGGAAATPRQRDQDIKDRDLELAMSRTMEEDGRQISKKAHKKWGASGVLASLRGRPALRPLLRVLLLAGTIALVIFLLIDPFDVILSKSDRTL